MIEREFPRVQQRPEQVLGRLAERRRPASARPTSATVPRRSAAGRRRPACTGSRRSRSGAGLEFEQVRRDSRSGSRPCSRSRRRRSASSACRRLSGGRGDRGAAVGPGAAAEGVEDRGWPSPGRCTSMARRRAGFGREAVGHVGGLRQGVGHLVGRQRAGHLVREEAGVVLVARHGAPRTGHTPPTWRPCGSGRGGRTCARRSAAARASSNSGWTGGFDAAEVVGRVGEPLAEELGPDPVGHRAGEVRVVGRGHPVGERPCGGRPVSATLTGVAAEQPRLGGLLGPRGARPAPSGRA